MDANRIAEVQALLDGTTPEPSVGFEWAEICIRTDEQHRSHDVPFYRLARGIVLELIDEIDQMHLANRLLTASVNHLQDEVSRLNQVYTALHVQSAMPDNGSTTAHVVLEYMDG